MQAAKEKKRRRDEFKTAFSSVKRIHGDLSNEWSTLSKSVKRDGERRRYVIPLHCNVVHGWENAEFQRVTGIHLAECKHFRAERPILPNKGASFTLYVTIYLLTCSPLFSAYLTAMIARLTLEL